MVFMGILTACESSKEEQEIQNQETTQEVEGVAEKETNGVSPGEAISDNSESKEYKDGDMITYTSGLKVTIVSSGLYTKPDPFDSTVVEKYAFLEIDMENTGNDDITMTGSFFKFYADGYALSNVWLNEDGELPLVSTLSSGRKVKGRVYAEGPEINSAERIEAELGKAVIRIYEHGDYGIEPWEMLEGAYKSSEGEIFFKNYTDLVASFESDYPDSEYAMYDLDQDGIEEVILSWGTCTADWQNSVYSMIDGRTYLVGTYWGLGRIYAAEDGIYSVTGSDVLCVEKIEKEGVNLVVTESEPESYLGHEEIPMALVTDMSLVN